MSYYLYMYEIQNAFSKSHKSVLNCILHFITLGIGLSSFFRLIESIFENMSFILNFFYCFWLFNNIPADLWLPSVIYTFICWLSKSWFSFYSSIIGIILGYVLQDFSHYYTGENTFQSTYQNNKDSLYQLINHTVYLVPLMMERGKYMLYDIAKFFTNDYRVIEGKITKMENLESINNWVISQNPSKDHTTHWWYNDLPDKVKKMFEKIANSPEMNSSFRKLYPSNTWMVERIVGMDEIYVATYEHHNNSDTVFFKEHIDGPFGIFPLCSVYRTLVAINPNDYICTKFPTNPNNYTLDTGDIIGFDFNRKVHYIDANKGVSPKDYRIVLKIHYVVGPKILSPLVNLLAILNTIYDKIARNAFLFTLIPKTFSQKLLAHFILMCTDFYKNIELKLGFGNITWLLSSLFIKYIFKDSNQVFILLTSFIHYIRYISTYFVRNKISFYEFKRDCFFWKFIALGQLFFYYSLNLTSLLLIIIGFGLSILAYQRIGTDATYFGVELGIIKSPRSVSFPYGFIPHPMILGSCIAIYGIGMGLDSEYIWAIYTHLAFYILHGLQEHFDIHYANSGYLDEKYLEENTESNSKFIKTDRGNILHYILEMKDDYEQIIVAIAGHGGHASSDLLISNNRYVYFKKKIGYCGIDLEGQGKSSGIRAVHSDLLNTTSHDVLLVLNKIREIYPNVKIILSGFSLGGGVALNVALKYPNLIDKLVLQNPYFKVREKLEPSKSKNIILQLMSHFMPYSLLPFPKNLIKNYNEDFYQKFVDDPLCWCGSMRFSTVCSAQKLSDWNISNIYKLKIPTLVQLSLNDQLLCPLFTKSIFTNLNQVELIEYEDAGHDYFENDDITQNFIADGFKWVENSSVDDKICF